MIDEKGRAEINRILDDIYANENKSRRIYHFVRLISYIERTYLDENDNIKTLERRVKRMFFGKEYCLSMYKDGCLRTTGYDNIEFIEDRLVSFFKNNVPKYIKEEKFREFVRRMESRLWIKKTNC